LLEKRNLAKKAKNFKEADALRDQILALGFIIEDTPQGARLVKK
jgi:cysteinyl-tRNA synthetase